MDIRNGQSVTNIVGNASDYVNFDVDTGVVTFVGNAGLPFGSIFGFNQDSTITISGTGADNKVQVIAPFTTNGESNDGVTPAEDQGHLLVTAPGRYVVNVTMTVESGVGAGYLMSADIWKNNGATRLTNLHAHAQLAGGGGDTTHISLTGIAEFDVNDTVEIWVYNDENTVDIVVDDINLAIHQVGGVT